MRRALRRILLCAGLACAGPLAAQTAGTAASPDALPLATLTTRADAGDVAAQRTLADRYHDGAGVVQNFARAAEWYARAAAAGNAHAQNRLGQYRYEGLGGPPDRTRALELLRAAADQGAPEHQVDLARVIEADDPAGAAALYEAAAGAGLAEAQVSLGLLYQEGRGVAQDPLRAAALYETAAQAGHPRALNNLGLLYVRGEGVAQDYPRAAELFAAAAETGLKPALRNLGVMYENGFGVAQSDDEAARLYRLAGGVTGDEPGGAGHADGLPGLVWDPRLAPPEPGPALDRAAAAGDPVAAFQLGWWLAMPDRAAHADLVRAAALFETAARAGHGPAMVNLGLMYFAGRGRAQDYVLGQMWLLLAGQAGFAPAARLSAATAPRMTAAQLNEAQSRAERLADGAARKHSVQTTSP